MELRICREHGISHSHFHGGKRRWTSLDRDKAKALVLVEAEECPQCHTLREDWVDEQGRPLSEPVWTADLRACPGCKHTKAADEAMSPEQRKAGAHVILTPLVEYQARNGS